MRERAGTWPDEREPLNPPHTRHHCRGSTQMLSTLPPAAPPRRVRQQVRDAAAVVAFSAGASTCLALAFLLLVRLAG